MCKNQPRKTMQCGTYGQKSGTFFKHKGHTEPPNFSAGHRGLPKLQPACNFTSVKFVKRFFFRDRLKLT